MCLDGFSRRSARQLSNAYLAIRPGLALDVQPQLSERLYELSMSMAATYALASRLRPEPCSVPSCHPRAISEGRSRYRADNHVYCHATAELAVSRSFCMNASREYA
jgi:hypothetical protein